MNFLETSDCHRKAIHATLLIGTLLVETVRFIYIAAIF